ncbi:MAG: hypothetical protein O3C40_05920 [Planctomycetota bacterium]|nr:hypothetical protein [Planctomycetota bacterium]
MFVSQRHAPTTRQRAANPSSQTAKTSATKAGDKDAGGAKRNAVAPVSRPFDDAAHEAADPIPVKTTPEVTASPQMPAEIAKPAVVPHQPDATRSEPTQPVPAQAQPASTAPQTGTLFQVVDIQRSPTFSIQGLETKQSLHYQVLSQLEIERDVDSRTTKVIQIVQDTRLVAADDLSRASFSKALDGLKRQQYTYRLNHRGEVIDFTGHKESRTTIALDLAAGAGFQLTSVIDEDGWKELAELTFVVPPDGQQAGEPWKRQMTHDWGALGNWSGITTFSPQPPKEQLAQITFTREMNYTAPGASGGGLPFQIRHAAFELQRASGAIEFDVALQRVRKATESFDVRGTVSAELAGIEVQIELTEQQRIEIIVSDQRLSLQ